MFVLIGVVIKPKLFTVYSDCPAALEFKRIIFCPVVYIFKIHYKPYTYSSVASKSEKC